MKLHARTMKVQRAQCALRGRIIDLQEEHDLTDVEMVGLLIAAAGNLHKYVLRVERHPDDPDRKADEA